MQNTNIVVTYDYYTLDQARQIIAEENKQKAIRRAERKARKRVEAIYYIKQKLSGLTMAAVGIITPILLDGDYTFSLFALLLPKTLLFLSPKPKFGHVPGLTQRQFLVALLRLRL